MEQRNFKNHETKTVYTLLSNDEGFYNLAEKMRASSENWIELSDMLKSHFEDLKEATLRNPTRERVELLLDIGSLCDVDFDHIAQDLYQE